MNTVTVIIILIISILLNIIFVWYIIKLLQEFKFISDDVDGILETVGDFSEHLERLYELELYYGDESLKSLIRHSKNVVEEIKEFETVISSIKKEETADEEEE
jgi:predicted PurR-regulated permease PerM